MIDICLSPAHLLFKHTFLSFFKYNEQIPPTWYSQKLFWKYYDFIWDKDTLAPEN
jgi:hypothetical protein